MISRGELKQTRRPVGVLCKCYTITEQTDSLGFCWPWGQGCCGDRSVVGPITCRHGLQLYLDHSPGTCSNVLSTESYFRKASLELSLGTGTVSSSCVEDSLPQFIYMCFSVETLLRERQVQPDEKQAPAYAPWNGAH